MAETTRPPPVAAPEPVGGPSAPAKNGRTVIVACRIPHGMMLRTFDIVPDNEVTRNGLEKVLKAVRRAGPNATFTAKGPGRSLLVGLTADQIDSLHPYGYAVTPGCPEELWIAWHQDNIATPYVTNNHIFADTTMERVRNRAAEYTKHPETVMTGLEPIDPDNPSRRVRGEGGLRLARGDRTDTTPM